MAIRSYGKLWFCLLTGLLALSLVQTTVADSYVYVVNSYVHGTSPDWSTVAKVDGEDLSLIGTVMVGDNAHSIAMVQSPNRLWVTCPASDQIAVINPSTMELVDNIEIEGADTRPMGIAVSPYNGRVYVTFEGTGSVGIFDPGERELISTVYVGGAPNSITFTPSGDKAYVVDYQRPAIYVIDAVSDTLITTLSFTGSAIQDAVSSPDGSFIYLANMDQNKIEVIRIRDNTILAPMTTSLRPRGIAISRDGRHLFLGHFTAVDAYVDMIRLSDGRIVSTAPIPSNPRCIAVSSDGQRIFVTEHNENALYAYDVSGETLDPVGHIDLNTVPGQYASPVGLVVQEVALIVGPVTTIERPPRPADLLPDLTPLRYRDTLPTKPLPWIIEPFKTLS
jgi:YVTN family beta-propeller protein